MDEYVVAHFHNPASGAEDRLPATIEGAHLQAVRRLRGFSSLQRFEVTEAQLMPDIVQPWRYLSLYEFRLAEPELHLPALATPLADLRDAGLIAADGSERIYTYKMYAPWKYSADHQPGRPLDHLMLLLANYIPGREAEYHRWYDDVHFGEVTSVPGFVSLKRGGLSSVPVPPARYCPGDQLILGGLQTDSLAEHLREFQMRGSYRSTPELNFGPRSTAASSARTVHIFKTIQGPFAAA
jgi:hypothetical protein